MSNETAPDWNSEDPGWAPMPDAAPKPLPFEWAGDVQPIGTDTKVNGQYGELTISTDGSYSYQRDAGTAGGGTDVFTYTLKDGDGDLTHTTLTITLGTVPPVVGEPNDPATAHQGATVYEAALAPDDQLADDRALVQGLWRTLMES